MSYKSKELRETRAVLAKQMAEVVSKAKTENRGLNAEERQTFDRMDDEQKKLLEQAEGYERIEKFEDGLVAEVRNTPSMTTSNRVANDPNAAFRAWLSDKAGCLTKEQEEQSTRQGYDVRNKRFELRSGAAQSSVTSNLGAEFVPTTLADFIDQFMIATSPILNVARVINTPLGNTFKVPVSDDTANAAVIIAQSAADSVQEIPTNVIQLASYMLTSNIIKLPLEWIRDSQFDVVTWCGQELGKRFSRGVSSYLCTGTGSSQPQGYSVGASAGIVLASKTAVTYTEMITAIHDVPLFYRNSPGMAILCSDSFAKDLRLQVDSQNRPLWEPAVVQGNPDTYAGRKVYIDPYLGAMGNIDTTVAVLGDFSEFLVRKVGNWEVATPTSVTLSTGKLVWLDSVRLTVMFCKVQP